ncbi:IQ and AAA domain-containing protein 1-like isoform X2 [Megachile rotundata]|uniref:IQ and AAA domain-containing protein 1-like isoform X2 n=1 Tax=Megachile rotundata TaxID=143995 RepID=UPI003FD4ADB8
MSYAYYSELWLIARNDLEKLLELDQRLRQQRRTERKEQGLNLLVPTYLRYRNLVKRLIVCHDQMVQSQKRDLIKRVLDCSIGRMLEYKREIVKLNYSDYLWPDDSMKQLKYTTDDLDLSVSATGKDVLCHRRKYIEELIEDALKEEAESLKAIVSEIESIAESEESMPRLRRRKIREKSTESKSASVLRVPSETMRAREAEIAEENTRRDAILLLQSHERARRGRCAGIEAQRIYNYNKKIQAGQIVPKKMSRVTFVTAARTIQRAWRSYLAKKKMKKRRDRIEELLDMTIPSWKSREILAKDEENFQKRLESMPLSVVRVSKMTDDTRARLWKIRGPGLMEDITDEIREWFIIWYDRVGHYDAYPAARLGGSVLIVTGQTLTPEEYLVQRHKAAAAGKAAKDSGTKKKKKFLPWIAETKAATLLDDTNQDFVKNWSFRDRSNSDPREKVYEDLIKDQLCYELQLEMRRIVDELMRLELEKLNTALTRDYKADKRELNIPKDKSKKTKGKKGRRKKKGALDDVPVQDIFNELVKANIIRNYPVTSLKDWIGDLSYQNYEADREFRDYNYRMGEVKQIVMDYCIIPLSSKEVHQIAPLIRAVCICGLPRHGKSFLVNAVCSEVGALLFDMTPNVLVGKYVGRKNERKLMNMISKVAREYAPSIIFIDNGEKPWLKKVPPEERQYQPKRFARHYTKLVKSIKRGDQILFLTTSSEPYKATRPFVRIHDKFIMIPLTDYNTLYMFYKDLLMKYHGIDRNIDVSCLAKMSVSIPLEFIRNAVENVLNLRRRITLKFKPLNQQEIMEEVFKYESPPAKTLKQLRNFENRTPLGRMRMKMLAKEKEERERLAKQKKARK